MLEVLFWIFRLFVFALLLGALYQVKNVDNWVFSYIDQNKLSSASEREAESIRLYLLVIMSLSVSVAFFTLVAGVILFPDMVGSICLASTAVVIVATLKSVLIQFVASLPSWKTDLRLIYHGFTSFLESTGDLTGEDRELSQKAILRMYAEEDWLIGLGVWVVVFFISNLAIKILS